MLLSEENQAVKEFSPNKKMKKDEFKRKLNDLLVRYSGDQKVMRNIKNGDENGCKLHNKNEFIYYCKNDQQFLCKSCIFDHFDHVQNNIVDFEDDQILIQFAKILIVNQLYSQSNLDVKINQNQDACLEIDKADDGKKKLKKSIKQLESQKESLKQENDKLTNFNKKLIEEMSKKAIQEKEKNLEMEKQQQNLQNLQIQNQTLQSQIENLQKENHLYKETNKSLTQRFLGNMNKENVMPPITLGTEKVQIESKIVSNPVLQAMLTGLLSNVKGVRMLYRASRDSFKSEAFRRMCGNKGCTLTLVLSNEQRMIFGGYTDIPWNPNPPASWQGVQGNHNSFIFKYLGDKLYKMPHKKQQKYETYHREYLLASFGQDLCIEEDCNENINSCSNIGLLYEPPQGIQYDTLASESYMAGTEFNFSVAEIEVFQIIF